MFFTVVVTGREFFAETAVQVRMRATAVVSCEEGKEIDCMGGAFSEISGALEIRLTRGHAHLGLSGGAGQIEIQLLDSNFELWS